MVGLVPTEWAQRIKPADFWLLSILKHFEVPFVIVSGAATAFYGCRDGGFFDDIDLFLSPTKANSRRFAKAMNAAAKAAGRNVASPFPPLYMKQPNLRFKLDVSEFSIDFNTASDPLYFNQLDATATVAKMSGVELKIISICHLITLLETVVENRTHDLKNQLADADFIKQFVENGNILT